MQLNKYLASCGIASRRKANNAILDGRISVNDEVVLTLGRVVEPDSDTICLDGRRLELPQRIRYVLLNKPRAVITSSVDGRGRKTVLDIVDAEERLFPVGRLDLDTEGVLLLTNDGDLAYRLTHPKFEVDKIYEAWVEGFVDPEVVRELANGVSIEPGKTVTGHAKVLKKTSEKSLVRIRLHEGKKRQVKRMMKAVGYPVLSLNRIVFAGLTVGDLKIGEWRDLTDEEVETLYRLVGLEREEKRNG